MKKIITGMVLAVFITGCSSLPTGLESEYEKLLASDITNEKVTALEKKYLVLKNHPDQQMSAEELKKIDMRLQVLEDLKN